MPGSGRLTARFSAPHAGMWDVWLKGQIMPSVSVGIDGRRLASVNGLLDGTALFAGTAPPIGVRLSAGPHRLTVTRSGMTLAPGDGGAAILDGILLTPAGDSVARIRHVAPGDGGRALCTHSYAWVEAVRAPRRALQASRPFSQRASIRAERGPAAARA